MTTPKTLFESIGCLEDQLKKEKERRRRWQVSAWVLLLCFLMMVAAQFTDKHLKTISELKAVVDQQSQAIKTAERAIDDIGKNCEEAVRKAKATP